MDFRCLKDNFSKYRTPDDGTPTVTYQEQAAVEKSVELVYNFFKSKVSLDPGDLKLERDHHELFLLKGIHNLSQSYECLDASRPWMCYWILHSMELLDMKLSDEMASWVVQFLGKCQCIDGGFAGGPGQFAHLAPTYAAVNALCIIGTQEAYDIIDRATLQQFLLRMHMKDGSFQMHDGGELDIRGAYCAATSARLTNILCTEMFEGTPEWIVRCQTYEGGFAGLPGMEAHGGYSFCGLAALILLGKDNLCDIPNLLWWTCKRQMAYEGGFQGRTNKMVDGCYSFWQGGTFPLLHMVLSKEGTEDLSAERWMFLQEALQEYVLICCQHPGGGLIDKPGKPRDYYHTCYCLSGLSVAQHFIGGKLGEVLVVGDPENELKTTHPVYNIGIDGVMNANSYFGSLSVPGSESKPVSSAVPPR